MNDKTNIETESEAVGLFEDAVALQTAIDELLMSGFRRDTLSLLANGEVIEEQLHHTYYSVRELEDDPDVPRSSYISPESIGSAEGGLIGGFTYLAAVPTAGYIATTGGALIAIASASIAAGAVGALIGATLATALDDSIVASVEEHLLNGGLILWVRTWDQEHERRATEILKKHGAKDVHLHKIPSAA